MTALTAPEADRLAKLCGMFGSDHDGERASAAAKADALVRQSGMTWRDVISVPENVGAASDWRHMAHYCHAHADQLRERERAFIASILKLRGDLSERQRNWLADIRARLGDTQ
jgi:hypothetical protein